MFVAILIMPAQMDFSDQMQGESINIGARIPILVRGGYKNIIYIQQQDTARTGSNLGQELDLR